MNLESLLLVEPDPDYLSALSRDPAYLRLGPEVTGSGEEARLALSKPGRSYRAIVVSAGVTSPGAVHLIRIAHEHHPATPLFLIYDGEAPLSPQETFRLALRGCIRRPASFTELWDQITMPFALPSEEDTHPEGSEGGVILEESHTGVPAPNDSEFRPVSISQFLTGFPSLYDIYIRVPTGRYLKILNAKDTLEPHRARHYISLGVDRLYIRRASHDRLLSYCDMLASALIRRSSGISVQLKFGELASSGAELARMIRRACNEMGGQADLGDAHLDFAFTYLADLFSLVKQLEKQPLPLVRNFLRSGALMDSGVATSMVAGMMALPLGLGTSRSFIQLGMAALLHDIGLLMLPKPVRETPPELLREEEVRVYQTHPQLGAEALRPVSRRLGSVTLQAIAQHHERRDGTGFPRRAAPTEIHLFAEVIGLADELLGLLRERRVNPKLDVVGMLELRILPRFSPKIAEAFRAVFLPKPPPQVRPASGTSV